MVGNLAPKPVRFASGVKKDGLNFLKNHPLRAAAIALSALAVFLLPGQNRYQTTPFRLLPPAVRPLTTTYASPRDYPINRELTPPPILSARAALLVDLDSMTVMFRKNPHLSLPPASITKLMTAWVARHLYSLDEVISVPEIKTDGSNMHLLPGERLTVRDLLQGLLMNSANDAALTLAAGIPGGIEQFLQTMNETARTMSLKDTQYANVTGIDSHNHYTSVWDIAQLSSIILTDKTLANIVRQKAAVVTSTDGSFVHHLKNTNKLLRESGNVKGLKTGWTKEAGGCLVAYLVRNDHHRLLAVLLGSRDEETRFSEALDLFRWAGVNYVWEAVEPPSSIQAFATAGT